MKTLDRDIFSRQRPGTTQEVLRLFSAGNSPRRDERLRYLARPHYRMLNSRVVTFAGDGHVYLWAHGRIPGFSDYEVPPAGYGHIDVAALLNQPRSAAIIDCPEPSGPWRGHHIDEVPMLQAPARVRRYDLARLATLDTVSIGPGEETRTGVFRTGWKTLSLQWRHGTATGAGLIICQAPARARRGKQ